MRITVHDFSGHPFQAELSRSLAAGGHDVEHLHAEQYVSGKGHLDVLEGDAPTLAFHGLNVEREFTKYAPAGRVRFEWAFGRAWIERTRRQRPDVTIASNVPLIAHFFWAVWARLSGHRWVFWHQDIYSAAMGEEARARLPRPLGTLATFVFDRMERYCARTAAHVVAIGDGFCETYRRWGIAPERTSVISNWAPLDKVYPTERVNARSGDVFDDSRDLRLLYAGTLGRKHNPLLLLDLLRSTRELGVDARLTVVSEGCGADELRAALEVEPDLPVRILPFQPAADLPEVLGSADVLVALLEPDATAFSIPSKVLSYMAAGRPILGLMPSGNPAAEDILDSGGHVADATVDGASASAAWLARLADDPHLVEEIGRRARKIAEEKFDLLLIAPRFERIVRAASADDGRGVGAAREGHRGVVEPLAHAGRSSG